MRFSQLIRACAFVGLVGFANSARANVILVDSRATGANNGTTWLDAFPDLQPALAAAQNGDEIWVALGTYRPAPAGGARTTSFELRAGVALYGGFAGTETALSQRNLALNPTILSGDLNGDDGAAFANDGENSFHVVHCSIFSASATLDGFIVQGGNATPSLSGGGIFHAHGSASYTNVVLRANRAAFGGGTAISDGVVHLVRCTFAQNAATTSGGGLTVATNSVDVHESSFIGNSASLGGGFFDGYGGLAFENCIFSGNTASYGGAVHDSDSSTYYINCTFSSNHATTYGGGIQSDGKLTSSIRSCILWGNTGATGGTVENQHSGIGFSAGVTTCTIQGFASTSLAGTNGLDPKLMDPLGADGLAGTSDDDLRIRVGSPCIDAGSIQVPVATTDIAGMPRLADDPNTPQPSQYNSIVDRGAHEYQPCPVPENYCTTSANSVGAGSLMGFTGTGSVLANNLVLRATGNPPSKVGIFIYSNTASSAPLGNGVLCVAGTIRRLPAVQSDVNGVASQAFDVHAAPALVAPGQDWCFQYWYRDTAAGGAGFNLSDGLLAHFCP